TFLGFHVDCSSPWQYYSSPICWDRNIDEWINANLQATENAVMAAGPMPTMRPAAPSTIPEMTDPGAWTPDQAIAQGDADWTNALNAYFARVQGNLDALDNPAADPNNPANSFPWKWVAVGAGAVAVILILRK